MPSYSLVDQILQAALLKEFGLVLLQVADNLGTASNLAVGELGILDDGEGTTSGGLPDVLLVVVVLGNNGDFVGSQVSGVETDTELTNHGDVTTSGHGFHKRLGTGLRDSTQVVHHLVLGHTDTGILDGQGGVGLVRDDADEEVRLRLDLLRVRDGLVTDLIQGIGGVGHQLTQEDFLVAVEGVDDQGHQLLDVSIEGEGFRHLD